MALAHHCIQEKKKKSYLFARPFALSFKLLDANNKDPHPLIRAYRVSTEANKA